MATPFTMRDTPREGIVTVALTGDVDLAIVDTLRDHVRALSESAATTGVVIDLAGVTFLDSSGIGVLIGCRKTVLGAGHTFQVINAQGTVAYVLDLTGVSELFAAEAPPTT